MPHASHSLSSNSIGHTKFSPAPFACMLSYPCFHPPPAGRFLRLNLNMCKTQRAPSDAGNTTVGISSSVWPVTQNDLPTLDKLDWSVCMAATTSSAFFLEA